MNHLAKLVAFCILQTFVFATEFLEIGEEADAFMGSGIKSKPLYVTELETTTEALPFCPPDYLGGKIIIPHPTDCSKGQTCVLGSFLDFPCPFGRLFDYLENGCRPCEGVQCKPGLEKPPCETSPTTPNPTPGPGECPETGRVTLPHPYDCSKYIECNEGNGIERSCPEGMLFDMILLVCRQPQQAICYEGATTSTATPSTTTSMPDPYICPTFGKINLPFKDDCMKYTQCNDGVGVVKSCAVGFNFDANMKACKLEPVRCS